MAKLKSDQKVAKGQDGSQGKSGKGKGKERKSNAVTALEARLTLTEGNVIKGFLKPENIAKLLVCIQKHIIVAYYIVSNNCVLCYNFSVTMPMPSVSTQVTWKE